MARGYIVVTELTIIHGVPLGVNTYRVAVQTTVDPEDRLPIPISNEIYNYKNGLLQHFFFFFNYAKLYCNTR